MFYLAVCAVMFALGVPMGFLGFAGAALVSGLLIVLFQVPVHLAFGTALGSVFATIVFGGWSHFREGNVDVLAAVQIGLAGVIGAYLGGSIALATAAAQLKLIAGVLLLFNSVFMYVRMRFFSSGKENSASGPAPRRVWRDLPGYGTIGLVCGLMSGFLGIGAIPFVQTGLLVKKGIDLNRIIGTSMFAMALASISGAARFALGGQLDGWLLSSVVLGMTAGSYIGAKMTRRAPRWLVKTGIVVTPFITGWLMILAPING
ncbi:MAG: sulfite exporter TauE/SafE family protein [Chloroflexota bacterium]